MLTEQEAILRMALAIGLGAALGLRARTPGQARRNPHLRSGLSRGGDVHDWFHPARRRSPRGRWNRLRPFRIGSTIVQGIGFLAAGVLFSSRGRVQGLTTAAGFGSPPPSARWIWVLFDRYCGRGNDLSRRLVILGWLEETADISGGIDEQRDDS